MRLLSALLAAFVLAPLAAAQHGPVFGLRPLGRLAYAVDAGSVIRGTVVVTSTGDGPGTVKLYPADATTGDTTGVVYLTDSAPVGVGTWISVGSSQLELKTGQRVQVPFTVHVPRAAGAGDYVGGIVAETVSTGTGPIRARNLSIVAVDVAVSGAQVARFTIGTARVAGTPGRQQLLLHVSNDGNVIRKPHGSIAIAASSGRAIETVPFSMNTFLPLTAVDYPVPLPKALPAGTYVADVRLTYPGTGAGGTQMSSSAPQFAVSKQSLRPIAKPARPVRVGPGGIVAASKGGSSFWTWLAIALGVLVLAGGGYYAAVLLRRRPVTAKFTPVEPRPAVAPPPPEPVRQLCEGFHYWQVDWDHGELGPDGVLSYPHRCRNCGVEVRATDINDAAAKAAS